MYRSTEVRDNINSKIPVGHFHLANLGDISRIQEVTKTTKEIITKIIK